MAKVHRGSFKNSSEKLNINKKGSKHINIKNIKNLSSNDIPISSDMSKHLTKQGALVKTQNQPDISSQSLSGTQAGHN